MKLGTKLSLALVGVAVVPLAITTQQVVSRDLEALEAAAKDYHLAIADVAQAAALELVDRVEGELRTFGAARADEGAAESGFEAAQAALLGAEYLQAVATYDANGRRLETMKADGVGAGIPAPAALDEGLRNIAQLERRLALGVQFGADGKALLPMMVPVVRGDEEPATHFVWTAVDLTPLSQTMTDISRRRFDGEAHRVKVVDSQLVVIAAHRPDAIGHSIAGKGIAADMTKAGGLIRTNAAHTQEYVEDGEARIGAMVPIPELSWAVVVEQSQESAYAAARRTLNTALVIGGIGLLVAVLLGLLLGRRLAAPAAAVSAAAAKVAEGDFEVRVPDASGDEIGQMGRAFNKMAVDLVDYRAQLLREAKIREDLSRYLSAEVAESVIANPGDLKLGGERREITVMFADIVSFTGMVEAKDPEFVVGILNELYTIVSEIVFKHGGIIDKFIGDCAMAVFGAPYSHDDDPVRAVRAAEEILRWLDVGNAKWRAELGHDLQLAIGIATGPAVVGNLGSEKRMEYTAIGHIVNTAARLEDIARPGQILMTRETIERVGDEFDALSLGNATLAGTQRKSEVFALED